MSKNNLHNFYYLHKDSVKMKAEGDSHVKTGQKFYCHALDNDRKNVYAANGIGMICQELGEVDVAEDIFRKVQDAHMPVATDINMKIWQFYMDNVKFLRTYENLMLCIIYKPSIGLLLTQEHLHTQKNKKKIVKHSLEELIVS